jgi:hypothetical protein
MTDRNSNVPPDERFRVFHEQYGNELDAGAMLADVVTAVGDYLARIIDSADVDAGMATIVESVVAVGGGTIANPGEWRPALATASMNCFSEWPLGARLHDLTAYALYGIVLHDSDDEHELTTHVEELVRSVSAFTEATPFAQWGLDSRAGASDLARLVRQARGRWALDNDQPVEPAALADFGGVSEGRIRNMMSGAAPELRSEKGKIPAQEALRWLSGRREFWTSIWREQRLMLHGVDERPPLESPIFVPVARDDTAFHPGLRRGSGYTIGEKGSEVQIADFEAALAELQRMPTPYWRRSNASGNWGIVAGIRWQRVDASDLEILAASPGRKLPDYGRA